MKNVFLKVRSKLLILIKVIILISIINCKNESPEFEAEYLIGKWTHYGGRITENGITKNDSLISSPIQYEFKENGVAVTSFEEGLRWKLSERKEILISMKDQTATYSPVIISDSTMTLKREFNGRIFLYYFKRGWTE